MKKKLVSSILAFCMILSLLPMAVFAAEGDVTQHKITVSTAEENGGVAFGNNVTQKTDESGNAYWVANDTSVTSITFTVKEVSGKTGTVSVSSTSDATLTAPAEGQTAYTLSNITADVTIIVIYEDVQLEENEHTITVTTPSNGTVTTNPAGKATENTEVTVTATPDTGYKLVSVKVNDTDITDTLKFTLTENATITAEFEKETYAVTITAAENGTLTVMNGTAAVKSGDKVEYGTELTVTAQAADGYEFVAITVGGEEQSVTEKEGVHTATVTVEEAITIAAEFTKVEKVVVETEVTNGTASAEVTVDAITEHINNIVNSDDEDDSTLVIDATTGSNGQAVEAATAEVTLPKGLASVLVNEKDEAVAEIPVEIHTPAGSIKMPAGELADILNVAGADVTLVIDTNAESGTDLAAVKEDAKAAATAAVTTLKNPIVEPISVSFKKSDDTSVSVTGKTITLAFPIPSSLSNEKNPVVLHVDGNKYERMPTQVVDGNIHFETPHLSDFIAVDADTADALAPVVEESETPVTAVEAEGLSGYRTVTINATSGKYVTYQVTKGDNRVINMNVVVPSDGKIELTVDENAYVLVWATTNKLTFQNGIAMDGTGRPESLLSNTSVKDIPTE